MPYALHFLSIIHQIRRLGQLGKDIVQLIRASNGFHEQEKGAKRHIACLAVLKLMYGVDRYS